MKTSHLPSFQAKLEAVIKEDTRVLAVFSGPVSASEVRFEVMGSGAEVKVEAIEGREVLVSQMWVAPAEGHGVKVEFGGQELILEQGVSSLAQQVIIGFMVS